VHERRNRAIQPPPIQGYSGVATLQHPVARSPIPLLCVTGAASLRACAPARVPWHPSTRVSRYPRRRVVEERPRSGGHRRNHPSRPPFRASRPRTLSQDIPGVLLAHLSRGCLCPCLRVSLSLSLSLVLWSLSHSTRAGLTYHEKSEKGVVRGQEDTRRRMREQDEGEG